MVGGRRVWEVVWMVMEEEGRFLLVRDDNVFLEVVFEIFLKIVFFFEEVGLIGLFFKFFDFMEVESEVLERFLRSVFSILLVVVEE